MPTIRSLAVLALLASIGAAPTLAQAGPANTAGVAEWVGRHAVPLTTTDPAAPLDDLDPLRSSIGDATVVGLGESAHGAAEETTLKHRMLRFLVERLGFRTVAWEEDWSTGLDVDAYIHGGPQDLTQLVATMSPQYRTGEVADVLAWLRAYNAGRRGRDQVSFVGVEYYFTRPVAYDVVERYVAAVAPQRLAELRRHLDPLRPTSDDPFAHIERYSQVADKQPYREHARAVRDLVARLGDRRDEHHHRIAQHAIALHAATNIVSFYEHYAMTEADNVVYREARAADSLQWWQRLSGDRVVYWAASAHTADAPDLRIVRPGATDLRFASAGSHLHRRFGSRYVSIGFTADHGQVAGDPGQAVDVVAPSPEWFEAPLGAVPHATFALDLRARRVPPAVHRWLHDPITMRGLPQAGPGSVIDGGRAARWFDVIVHVQEVHPAREVCPPAGSC